MKLRDVIDLSLSVLIVGMLMPHSEINKLYFKKGVLVKVKWIDGSISKLRKGEWIHK